jgi:hypothetical protein
MMQHHNGTKRGNHDLQTATSSCLYKVMSEFSTMQYMLLNGSTAGFRVINHNNFVAVL